MKQLKSDYLNHLVLCKLNKRFENNDSMKNFKVISELGTGSFGKVELAHHIATGDSVAIKTISKQKLKTKADLQMVNK